MDEQPSSLQWFMRALRVENASQHLLSLAYNIIFPQWIQHRPSKSEHVSLKYQHPKIHLGSRSQAVILKREYYIYIPEEKVVISGRNNRKKEKIWSSLRWSCQPWDPRQHRSRVTFKNIWQLNLLGCFHQPQQTFKIAVAFLYIWLQVVFENKA